MLDQTGKEPIGTRWVDINKGDEQNPEYRSRLVAQGIHNSKRDDLFAATPPLEALEIVLSILTSTKQNNKWKLDSIDVRRAYFHAPARRQIYVNVPPVDKSNCMCGKLIKGNVWNSRCSKQLGTRMHRVHDKCWLQCGT